VKPSQIVKSALFAIVAASALTWLAISQRATADSATANFQVGAAVVVRCMIVTNGVHFGVYDPDSTTPLDTVGGVTASCSTWWLGGLVHLGQGMYPAPGSTDNNPIRRMASGPSRLRYQLYKNSSRTTVWNNSVLQAVYTGATPSTLPVYGRIPAGQSVPSGNYHDTVIATIFF
jgi:spore coat protein U-like protein